MKKIVICILLLLVFLFVVFYISKNNLDKSRINSNNSTAVYSITIKQDILCLMMAYPEYITGVEKAKNGVIYVVMQSGKKIVYDDQNNKNSEKNLKNLNLKYTMDQNYSLSNVNIVPDKKLPQWRSKIYDIFDEVYGASQKQIEANMVKVRISKTDYLFNHNNKAADALKAVMKELVPLAKSNKIIHSYIFPTGGTYHYRQVQGTTQLSTHSYGIAIDLSVKKAGYWMWTPRLKEMKRIKVYPKEIVRIFEKNNFVWGGKWVHFDMMHFEYRPEIILKAKYFGNQSESYTPWYSGVPLSDSRVKGDIESIDKVLNN